jgi:hypothetical protein
MWQGESSWCSCGRGEPSPGTDVAGASPVPAQSKPSPDVALSYVQRLLDATQAFAALMMAGTVGFLCDAVTGEAVLARHSAQSDAAARECFFLQKIARWRSAFATTPVAHGLLFSRLPLVAALAPLRCRPAERRQWPDHARCAWSVRKVHVEVRRSLRRL